VHCSKLPSLKRKKERGKKKRDIAVHKLQLIRADLLAKKGKEKREKEERNGEKEPPTCWRTSSSTVAYLSPTTPYSDPHYAEKGKRKRKKGGSERSGLAVDKIKFHLIPLVASGGFRSRGRRGEKRIGTHLHGGERFCAMLLSSGLHCWLRRVVKKKRRRGEERGSFAHTGPG